MRRTLLVVSALAAACCGPAAAPSAPTAHKMPAETPPTSEKAPATPAAPPKPVAPAAPSAPTAPVAPVTTSTPPEAPMPQEPNFYSIAASALDGSDAKLAQYRGKVALVVNVASECGFTKQYAGLEQLWNEYKDKGVVVIGFPSNEFGGQEPGDAAAIRSFCTKNYGVTFPLMSKVVTKKDPGQSPAYAYLVGATGQQPSWNFCKYLVGKDGKAVKFWKSQTAPESKDLRAAIDAAIAAK